MATLKSFLEQVDTAHKLRVVGLAWVRVVWVSVCSVAIAFTLDAVHPLPDSVRFAFLFALPALLVPVWIAVYWRSRRARSLKRMLIRKIEAENPDLENALINAADFEDRLGREEMPEVTETLMRLEIDAGAERAIRLPNLSALRPPSLKRETLVLTAALCAVVLFALVSPHILGVLLPRFLDPYGDHPPYCETRFEVQPAGVVLNYGESLKVTVTTSGPGKRPESVFLVLRNGEGVDYEKFPMFHQGEGVFFQTIENVDDDLEYFAEIPRGRSKRYPLTLNRTPKIEDIVVTYTPPAYTRIAPTTHLLSELDLEGYANTRVDLSLSSNRPLQGGELELPGGPVALEATGTHRAIGSFRIVEEGETRAWVEDVEGHRNVEPLKGSLEIVPDEIPQIAIVAPGMDSFAVPDAEIPIDIDVADDLGLTEIAVVRNHNGSTDMRKILYSGEGDEPALTVTETLDLADLGVRAGDTIEYYASATDSRPDKPQTVYTEAFRLRIISMEEYRNFAQTQMTATELREKYDKFKDEMKDLANSQRDLEEKTRELQQKAAEPGGLSPEDEEALKEAEAEQRELSEWAQEMAEKFKEESEKEAVFDVEKDYKETLKELSEKMAEASKKMREAEKGLQQAAKESAQDPKEQDPSTSPSLAQAAEAQKEALEQLEENTEQFDQKISQPNQAIERLSKVVADTEKFKYLYNLQKGIERRVRYYKDSDDPGIDGRIRLKELSEQQEVVREALVELGDEVRLHAEQVDTFAQETESNEALKGEIDDATTTP